MGNDIGFIVLFVLVALVIFAVHKHTSNKAIHKTPVTPTMPGPTDSGTAGSVPVRETHDPIK